MRLSLPLQTLRRLAERFDQPSVQFTGRGLQVSLGQERSPHEGGGVAWLRLEGTVQGDQVQLCFPEGATVEGVVSPDEAHALGEAGQRLLQVLEGLCRCARLPEDCDCCEACGGQGTREREGRREACWTCAGLGYDEDRWAAGSEASRVVGVRGV